MNTLFLVVLFLTFAITRILAHLFHDKENYGTKNENSKTLTGLIRKKTGFDIHHFHFGILILILTLLSLIVYPANQLTAIFLAIGISLTIDQLIPMIDGKSNYFHNRNILISLASHILVAAISLIWF
jgi:hypothetical protein